MSRPTDDLRALADLHGTGDPGDPWGEVERIAEEIYEEAAELRMARDHYREKQEQSSQTIAGIMELATLGDTERIAAWCRDHVSGYTEPVAATILHLSDDIAAAEKERDAATERAETWHRQMQESDAAQHRLTDRVAKLEFLIDDVQCREPDFRGDLLERLRAALSRTEPPAESPTCSGCGMVATAISEGWLRFPCGEYACSEECWKEAHSDVPLDAAIGLMEPPAQSEPAPPLACPSCGSMEPLACQECGREFGAKEEESHAE